MHAWFGFKLCWSLHGRKETKNHRTEKAQKLTSFAKLSFQFWRLEQWCLHTSLTNITAAVKGGGGGGGVHPCPVQLRDKSFLSARLLCSAAYTTGSVWLSGTHGTPNKKFLWEPSSSSEDRKTVTKRKDRLLADLHIKKKKKSLAGRGRSVRKNDEGPWICYRSLLRNGAVLPQPLQWRMEIRTPKFDCWILYAFTSTVLKKYPQVHLERTRSGTILFENSLQESDTSSTEVTQLTCLTPGMGSRVLLCSTCQH